MPAGGRFTGCCVPLSLLVWVEVVGILFFSLEIFSGVRFRDGFRQHLDDGKKEMIFFRLFADPTLSDTCLSVVVQVGRRDCIFYGEDCISVVCPLGRLGTLLYDSSRHKSGTQKSYCYRGNIGCP